MNILLVSGNAYPHGMAISKRIRLIAKGLNECGNRVSIRILNPTTAPGENDVYPVRGECPKGVFFEYSGGNRIWSNSWMSRRLQKLNGILQGAFNTFRDINDLDVVMLYATGTATILLHKFICLIMNKKIVLFRSEHPFFEKKSMFYKLIVRNVTHRFFNGYIVISKGIRQFYENIGIDPSIILIVPILNDFGLDANESNVTTYKSKTIFYCGDWSQHKDGLMTLLKAFSLVIRKHPDLKLELAGKPTRSKYAEDVNKYISQNNLNDFVLISGYLENHEFLKRMSHSTMFVLPKPTNFQAIFSMPSKLAEYLSTGKPVVVSDIGDLAEYLKNGISVYFTEPGDHESVASAINDILEKPENAKAIGEAGRKVAQEYFDYFVNCKKISHFLFNL